VRFIYFSAKSINGTHLEDSTTILTTDQNTRLDLILLTPAGLENATIEITQTAGQLTEDHTDITLNDSVPSYWIAIAAIITFVIAALLIKQYNEAKRKDPKHITSLPPLEIVVPKIGATLKSSEKTLGETTKLNKFQQEMLKIIREKGGAIEQKTLRRELPWSEARVSIELSELEKMGKVKKTKQGRANLVKLI